MEAKLITRSQELKHATAIRDCVMTRHNRHCPDKINFEKEKHL